MKKLDLKDLTKKIEKNEPRALGQGWVICVGGGGGGIL